MSCRVVSGRSGLRGAGGSGKLKDKKTALRQLGCILTDDRERAWKFLATCAPTPFLIFTKAMTPHQ
jgi:hypothetical protein